MRKKLKKYTGGGPTNWTETQGGQAFGQFGGLLGQGVAQMDQADGRMSGFGGFASGALTGAASGMAFGPLGAALGAGIGAISGLAKRDKFNAEQDEIESDRLAADRLRAVEAERAERAGMNNILAQYPVKGTTTPSFELGGPTGGGGVATTDAYEKYAQVFPTFATPAVSNDRLTNYSDAQMLKNEQGHNAMVDRQSLQKAKDIAGNVAAYHVDKPLDAIGMDLALIGQVPGLGEPFDLANASLSYMRGLYHGFSGDSAKAKEQMTLAGLSTASALPFAGNAVGAARLAHGAHNIAHGAHKLERGVIGAKGYKAATHTPTYAYGGPTGGGEKYHAIPNYGGSMDPNAQPSMDFYFQGQKMPAADFIKQLPEGMNINQVVAYGMDKAQPMFDPQTGWSNVGVNDYMRSFATSQGNTPTYAMGGTTLPQYEAEGGEMIQYKQGDMPAVYGNGGITEVSSQEYEIKGPSHAQGGVDMSDEKGARIYSNKLTVDPELMAKLNNL